MNILEATRIALESGSVKEWGGHEWVDMATGPDGAKVKWNPNSQKPVLVGVRVAHLTGHNHSVGLCMGWGDVREGRRYDERDARMDHPAINWMRARGIAPAKFDKVFWVTENWSSHERPVGTAWVPAPFEGWTPVVHAKSSGLYMLNARREYAVALKRDENGTLRQDQTRRTLVGCGNRGEWITSWGYKVEALGEVRSTPEAGIFRLEYYDGRSEIVHDHPFYADEFTFLLAVEPA